MDEQDYLMTLLELYGEPDGPGDQWTPAQQAWHQARNQQLGISNAPPSKDALLDFRESYIRNYLLAPILETLDPAERMRIDNVPIAFANLRTLNAETRLAPNGKPVILLNQGVASLVSYWWEMKAALNHIRKKSGPKASESHLLESYSFLLLFYANNGQASYPRSFEGITEEEMHVVLIHSIRTEIFILAHEVQHVLLNHLRPELDQGQNESEEMSRRGRQELDADRFGMLTYLNAWTMTPWFSGSLSTTDLLVPMDYFTLRHLIERNPEIGPSAAVPSGHPSAEVRAKALLAPYFTSNNPIHETIKDELRDWMRYFLSVPNLVEHFTEISRHLHLFETNGEEKP
ncbi:hypothetical protein [Arthrobacter sp. LAR12-1-1.1]|uniref:hypothetical protein n=1 Tax=Arthrobacter sp. LAR12-1-1.1 TaxID=3135215 RepID=UPI00343B045D